MSDEKNIINYTAADIEKYWNGKLSAAEMHAFEKAAMDDPFLADALEGYKNVRLPDERLDQLKEKLDRRVGAFVPIVDAKRNRFSWMKAAVAIIIIVGAGLLIQQLFFNRNESSIALDSNEKRSETVVTNVPVNPDSINRNKDVPAVTDTSNKKEEKNAINTGIGSFSYSVIDTSKKVDGSDVLFQRNQTITVPVSNEQVVANAERKSEPAKEKADVGRTVSDSTTLYDKKPERALSTAKPQSKQAYYENDRAGFAALNNTYNYRVVDAQKNPVPFANVMNTRDNVGTYTDIRGNFNLVSSDSILNVQIRSLGYNSANYKLVPSVTQAGDLVLKEDERKETVVQNRKVVSSASRKDSADIEEPEVGWGNYNTYVANNIQIPETRAKNTRSEVELSFDIDKAGQPVNIKVTRSSQCKECDEEAKRLLKEGPKWKRKGKRSKATISIAVDQK